MHIRLISFFCMQCKMFFSNICIQFVLHLLCLGLWGFSTARKSTGGESENVVCTRVRVSVCDLSLTGPGFVLLAIPSSLLRRWRLWSARLLYGTHRSTVDGSLHVSCLCAKVFHWGHTGVSMWLAAALVPECQRDLQKPSNGQAGQA